MSRDIYERDYYLMGDTSKPLPVKWMALESLKEGWFSSKSDVVNVEIVLWIGEHSISLWIGEHSISL